MRSKARKRLLFYFPMLVAMFSFGFTYAQETVSGTVIDKNGPVPGANVMVQGASNGTQTDFDGNYTLQNVVPDAVLLVSFMGYQTQEIPVDGREIINITLQDDQESLEKVVVVGYGTQSTRELTGAIENISSAELQDAPVAQVGEMLQGKIPGVRITQTTGRPGEGIKVEIRGSASITAGSEPLYVVDGMPIMGDISFLNPAEIESMSILKDAAATALYGSRGANGVVLIETKTALPGQVRMSLNSYYGYQYIPQNRKLDMMNAEQYARFQQDVAERNGRPVDPLFQNPEELGEGTDWYDAITRPGFIQSYNFSASAGGEHQTTSLTAGYFKQKGVVVGTGYERFSLRSNTRFNVSDRINVGFNVAPTYSTNTNFSTDGGPYGSQNIVSAALITTPLASPYNRDGSLALTASDPATFGNPNWLRVAREKKYEDVDFRLLSNAFVEYEIIDGLMLKTTANIQLGNSKLIQFNPSTIGELFNPPPRIPSGSEYNFKFYNWVNENTLNYELEIGSHNIEALAGFTAQKYRSEGTQITGTNYADDKIQEIGAAGVTNVSSDVQKWALLSYLARLNYNYESKYLLMASIRRDGSSRFGSQNRWGNFPSVSAGWVISEEDFWNIKPISFLKLRASYGITGNFNIGNYTFRPTINSAFYAFGNNPYRGRVVNNLGDQNLGWEKNQQFNIGGDLYLLEDRLQLSYNYYSKRTSDLLFNVNVPPSSGFYNTQRNIGELKFWGHEIGISSNNISTENLTWNTDFNISFNRNRTVALSGREPFLAHGVDNYSFNSHRTAVGQPIGMFFGAIHDGVYINQEDFENSPQHASSQVGTAKFRDLNDDGVITFPDDMTIIGSPWPDFTFGMTNNLTYRNFDASVVIAGSYGNEILSYYENYATNLDGVFNVLAEVEDRWMSPEDPGAGLYGSTEQGTTFLERDRWNTRYLKDGSYLSVKNITLGYNFPLNESSSITNFRIYGSAQNVLIVTNYPGPNPEVNTIANSSGSTPGYDANSYPIPRTISLGINLNF